MAGSLNLSTMFWKKNKRAMDLIQQFTPTSKAALKQFCLTVAKGNVKEAQDLYDFYIKDLENLPMFDPVPPTFIERAKTTAEGIMGFVRDNQGEIMQGVELVKAMLGKGGGMAPAAPAEPLAPIN